MYTYASNNVFILMLKYFYLTCFYELNKQGQKFYTIPVQIFSFLL